VKSNGFLIDRYYEDRRKVVTFIYFCRQRLGSDPEKITINRHLDQLQIMQKQLKL